MSADHHHIMARIQQRIQFAAAIDMNGFNHRLEDSETHSRLANQEWSLFSGKEATWLRWALNARRKCPGCLSNRRSIAALKVLAAEGASVRLE